MNPRERAGLIPHELPEYVQRPSDSVWMGPYEAQNVDLYGFVLASDHAALNRLLQRDLVVPSRGAVDYRSASEHILVVFTHVDRMTATMKPDCEWGSMQEFEAAIWCLAADMRDGHRLVWYLPYLYTDTGLPLTAGREVYGYPKQLGTFDDGYPSHLMQGGRTTVSATAIDTYSPQAYAQLLPMLSVHTRRPLPAGNANLEDLAAIATMLPDLIDISDHPTGPPPERSTVITGSDVDAPPPPAADPHWIGRVLDTLHSGLELVDEIVLASAMAANPTLVYLKQFRDVRCRDKACYQAVTEAPFTGLSRLDRAAGPRRLRGHLAELGQPADRRGPRDRRRRCADPDDGVPCSRELRGRPRLRGLAGADMSAAGADERHGGLPRVVVLGGGTGALTTAVAAVAARLAASTSSRSPSISRDGGSAARAPVAAAAHRRIEEHGLHIWFGSYHNAFSMLGRCHEELDERQEAYGLKRWDLAFKTMAESFTARREITVTDHDGCCWSHWRADFFNADDRRAMDRRRRTTGPSWATCRLPVARRRPARVARRIGSEHLWRGEERRGPGGSPVPATAALRAAVGGAARCATPATPSTSSTSSRARPSTTLAARARPGRSARSRRPATILEPRAGTAARRQRRRAPGVVRHRPACSRSPEA